LVTGPVTSELTLPLGAIEADALGLAGDQRSAQEIDAGLPLAPGSANA